jgi:hypothetical protein
MTGSSGYKLARTVPDARSAANTLPCRRWVSGSACLLFNNRVMILKDLDAQLRGDRFGWFTVRPRVICYQGAKARDPLSLAILRLEFIYVKPHDGDSSAFVHRAHCRQYCTVVQCPVLLEQMFRCSFLFWQPSRVT